MLNAPLSAQTDDSGLVIATSKSDRSSLELLDHIGFGYNLVKSDSFTPSSSGEFFVNIIDLKLYPSENFGIEIGVDYKTRDFNSKKDAFYLDGDNYVQAMSFSDKYPNADESSKNFSRFGLRSNPTVLSFMKDFGLILFVFSIGLQVGPGFFASFRKGGVRLNLLAQLLILAAL